MLLKHRFFKKVAAVLMAAAAFTAMGSAFADPALKICAVPQLYDSLELIREHSPVPVATFAGTSSELYAKISNKELSCDVLLSSDERLPITLIRASIADAASLQPFTRAPVILWSYDPQYFKEGFEVIAKKPIGSLSVPDERLTPPGFAATEILSSKDFPLNYPEGMIFKGRHEYQVYAMLKEGSVECGFITKPLIAAKSIEEKGSFIEIPRDLHSDIFYYAVVLSSSDNKDEAASFISWLRHDTKAAQILKSMGFAGINPDDEPINALPDDFAG